MHYFRNFLAPAGSSAECHKLHSSSCLDSGLRDASHMREGGGASATHGSIAVFEPRMYVAACGRVCKNSPYLSNGMQVQKQHNHAPAGSSADCLHSSACLDSGLRDASSHMRGGGYSHCLGEGGGHTPFALPDTRGSIAVFEPRMYVADCGRVCKNSPYLSNGMQVQEQHNHAPAGSSADCLYSSVCLDSGLRDASSHMRGGCHAMGDVSSHMKGGCHVSASSHMRGGCHGSAAADAHGAGSQSLFRHPSLHSTNTFNGLSFANSEWSLPSGSSRCSSVSAATTVLPSSP
jgi:hypothetical protein